MTDAPTELDRLISRFLDDECSSRDRAELYRQTAREPRAAALLDQQIALDREINRAMRAAMGRPQIRTRRLSNWTKAWRAGGFAVAASLAGLAWVGPGSNSGPSRHTASAAASRSWFSSRTPAVDCVVPASPAFALPAVQLREQDSEWILVPGDRPGEVLIVEVRRTQSQTLPVRQDF